MVSECQAVDDDIFEDDDDLFRNDLYIDDDAYQPLIPVYVDTLPPTELKQDKTQNANSSPSSIEVPTLKKEQEKEEHWKYDSDSSRNDLANNTDSSSAESPLEEELVFKRQLRSGQSYPVDIIDAEVRKKRPSPSQTESASKHQRLAEDFIIKEPEKLSNLSTAVEEPKKRSSESPRKTRKLRSKKFKLTFYSKLDGTVGNAIQIEVLGKYDFGAILEPVLKGLIKEFSISAPLKDQYTIENVTLYWNGSKLLKFMTCDSLKVSDSNTQIPEIDITMVSKDNEVKFEEEDRSRLLRVEKEAALKAELPSKFTVESLQDEGLPDSSIEIIEQEGRHVKSPKNEEAVVVDLEGESELDVLKLALVSQDNSRIYVNVRRTTPLFKVAEYFRRHRPVHEGKPLFLYFDHEKLDLNETVGEQDLEDEDMIEVVI